MDNFIEFQNVTFSYDEDEENNLCETVVENFSLQIKKGDFVAILGHNGCGKSTVAKLCNGINIPQSGKVFVDGPLSLDVALYKEVAEHKKVTGSSVAGEPDCLLFPNIESANVFFKAVTHMAGAELAAMVMGTKVPCVLTSRGDSALSKKYSIALACLSAR